MADVGGGGDGLRITVYYGDMTLTHTESTLFDSVDGNIVRILNIFLTDNQSSPFSMIG